MAVSSVLGPDGKTYTLEHPDGASQEEQTLTSSKEKGYRNG